MSGKPLRFVISWPDVVGRPVPTVPKCAALPDESDDVQLRVEDVEAVGRLVTVVLTLNGGGRWSVCRTEQEAHAPPVPHRRTRNLVSVRRLPRCVGCCRSRRPSRAWSRCRRCRSAAGRPTTRGTAAPVVPARPVVGSGRVVAGQDRRSARRPSVRASPSDDAVPLARPNGDFHRRTCIGRHRGRMNTDRLAIRSAPRR